MPIGLVLKEMGEPIPKTHLVGTDEIFSRLDRTNLKFNSIVKKAHQIDARYPNFKNQPLSRSQKLEVGSSVVRKSEVIKS